MIARNETIFKWFLYAAATAFCFFLQGSLLQRLEIWVVIPFLYPLLAAIPATFEGPLAGTIFSLIVGVFCDLLLPGPIPCLHTLVFPLAGLAAGLISQSWLPSGFLCSLVCVVIAFFLTDGFHCLLLWMLGKAAWETGALVSVREFCVSAPFILLLNPLYHSVFLKTHIDD